ncbi:probable ATP-dependent DNA helicase RecQ isoform X1 [Vitis riparia]|uniref:probable ATP-dependent DNA helicase RecQ isoform X1 n=2 Tax=Vitis riparia TaxID=96939 RepID=UPI00155AB445|nr:probable ATP-dependent DNA helicase RecQ isoform X1 [Vitis riparia]
MRAEKMESTLKRYFGYSGFRPYQKDIIQKILERRDSLVIMATGSGKSLCYQLPPLILGKTAIVISPLISLMQDQVMALKQRGIRAEFLASAQTDPTVHKNAESGTFHVLFMTPEKACSIPGSFWSKLLKVGICLFAVDEAHCISEWGHDFRMEYKQLDKLRAILLDVPFVGLTATATKKVRMDIINSLKMRDPNVFIGSFDRKNLFYGVKSFIRNSQFMDEFVGEISKFVASSDSTIIYCTTIKDVEQIYKSLQEAGIKAGIYHGQMANSAREESHRIFIRDEVHVMVATIAFGMGIDKPNIRHVIHYGCPKSLESYYQESGRCGRDGIASVCWLYYNRGDFMKADFYCGEAKGNQRRAIMDSLVAAQNYCLQTTCRRKFLLEYFGEKFESDKCGHCDNCTISKRECDMSREAFLLIACINSCRGHWGLNMPIDILRGSRSKRILDAKFDKLPLHGLGKDHSSNWWKALAYQLISYGYLMESVKDVYKTVSVSRKGAQFLSSSTPAHQPKLVLQVTNEMVDDEEHEGTSGKFGELKGLATFEYEGFSETEGQLYHMLLDERMKFARGIGTAPYAICGNETIKKIALIRPSTKARLANIDGVNQHFLTTYGDHFLQSIQHLSQALNLPLDGDASMQAAVVRKMQPVPNQQRKLTPAKYEAWKMWQEDGLSIEKVANFPSRSAPIKEQTVLEYLLGAAQEGFAIDWTRLCDEVGLTREMFSDIEAAITKVGSRDKLKPVKIESPEYISYAHIKVCLTLQDCGMSKEVIPPGNHNTLTADELPSKASEASMDTMHKCLIRGPCEVETAVDNIIASCCLENEFTTSIPFTVDLDMHPPGVHDEIFSLRKRQKIDEPEEESLIMQEATESSILDWLRNYDDGVPLSDVLKHFNGSSEEYVLDLLSNLEGEFMIFKKNNMYRLM